MVFKLVRTDTVEPCKISLPIGTHLLGRGKFLDCEDKRVSRNHGELVVTDDAVTIKALHQNPCFYKKKNITDIKILRKDGTIDLANGDQFGLLLDCYWFEVLYCPDLEEAGLQSNEVEGTNQQGDKGKGNEMNNKNNTIINNTDNQEKNYSENNDTSSSATNNIQETEMVDAILNETVENFERNSSPSLLQRDNTDTRENESTESNSTNTDPVPTIVKTEAVTPTITPTKSRTEDNEDTSNNAGEERAPMKREHSTDASDSPDDVKKVKTEPEDAKPGTSNDPQGSSHTDNQGLHIPPSPQKPPNPPPRERCMYGAGCYRRNPAHKAQFSHPSDADWGSGAQAPCPYGAACTKRDPRHWRDHEHPPGTQPPAHRPAPRKNTKRTRRKSEEEDSDDSSKAPNVDSDLIVTGKRARKTVKRESWSESEEEERDPYATDESDEWVPQTQDFNQTQDFDY